MKLLFYLLFIFYVIIGIILSILLNIIIGIITACVLLFINTVTFIVILKIEKKKKEVTNIKDSVIY